MYKYSFIQNINKLGISRLATSKWFILIIVLLAACAPTTQDNQDDQAKENNTIERCLHSVVEREMVSHNLFVECVHNSNQQLTGAVREEVSDYLVMASNSELQRMTQVVVKQDADSYMDSTKDEFVNLLLKEIADILSSKEKSAY